MLAPAPSFLRFFFVLTLIALLIPAALLAQAYFGTVSGDHARNLVDAVVPVRLSERPDGVVEGAGVAEEGGQVAEQHPLPGEVRDVGDDGAEPLGQVAVGHAGGECSGAPRDRGDGRAGHLFGRRRGVRSSALRAPRPGAQGVTLVSSETPIAGVGPLSSHGFAGVSTNVDGNGRT